jgi:hypothetical protein
MMAENHHAAWAAVAAERKAQRERNRAHNTRVLTNAGVQFAVFDNGWHLRIQHNGVQIDFMPGPGTWSMLGDRAQRRGVRTLLHYIATGELPVAAGGGHDD